MFELTKEEFEVLRYQFGTSKTETEEQRGGTRYMPFAFTEQGVAMLSSVLKSERAIEVNIAIMCAVAWHLLSLVFLTTKFPLYPEKYRVRRRFP